MSDHDRAYGRTVQVGSADMSMDLGLRKFMLGVYNKVGLGLLVSAAFAFLTGTYPPVRDLLYVITPDGALRGFTVLGMVVAFAPLGILLFGMFAMRNATPKSSGVLYWTIVSLIGASMGAILLRFTGASVFSTFLITAAAFFTLSLVGYTTKKNLTALGSFLIMGVVGLIIAGLVNLFVASSALSFIINAAGVLIFAGLIAYDTQRLKMSYYEMGGNEAALGVATNMGALNLYLDFINLFQFLLHFLGDRR